MKSNLKKTVAMLLALVMLVGTFAGCGKKTDAPVADKPAVTETNQPEESEQPTVTGEYVDPYADIEDYDEKSAAIYEDVLGGFMDAYQVALDEKENVSRRFALMAQAEAKLMETAVMMPMITRGGNYAINRLAPRSVSSVMWGGDAERRYSQIATTEFINVEDQNALKALWAEAKDGAEYQAAAKAYLEEHGYELTRELNESNPFEIKNWDVLRNKIIKQQDIEEKVAADEAAARAEGLEGEALETARLQSAYETYLTGPTGRFGLERTAKWYDYSTDAGDIADVRREKITYNDMLLEDCPTGSFWFGLEREDMIFGGEAYDVENDFHGIFYLCGMVGLVLYLLFLGFFLLRIVVALIRNFRDTLSLSAIGCGLALAALLIHAYFTCGVLRRPNVNFYLAVLLAMSYGLTMPQRSRKEVEE